MQCVPCVYQRCGLEIFVVRFLSLAISSFAFRVVHVALYFRDSRTRLIRHDILENITAWVQGDGAQVVAGGRQRVPSPYIEYGS